MFRHINKRVLTAATIVAAAGLPSAALARPLEDTSGAPYTPIAPAAKIATPPPATHADSAFHWGDAGFGAAGMLVVVGVGSGAVATVRRRHGHALAS